MARLVAVLSFVLTEFGPLVAFWAAYLVFGLKPAIATAVLWVACDVLRRRLRRLKFTRVYVLSAALVTVFGAIDLLSTSPFMLKYEAVISNLATAAFFAFGAHGRPPLLQELAEQRRGPFPDRPDVARFFLLFTYLWAVYFLVKAAFYFAVGELYPMATAMAVRSAVGSLSLGVMVVLSFTQGRRLFELCRALGLLPIPAEAAPEAST